MKHWKKIVFASFILLLVSIGSIVTIGYIRYDALISEHPLQDVVRDIKENANYIPLDQVDSDFIDALLAVEDPSFYTHRGIVLSNIMEAVVTNIKEQDYVMGGSTITQQLSKNLYLDQRKTFQRKIAEVFFVHDIESQLSKDEILELYINVIYFGDGYYGIKEASEGYFQCSPSELSIAQATLLAGLPQAPAAYQLSDGMTLAKKRQRIVLDAMEEQRLLTNTEGDTIYNQPV